MNFSSSRRCCNSYRGVNIPSNSRESLDNETEIIHIYIETISPAADIPVERPENHQINYESEEDRFEWISRSLKILIRDELLDLSSFELRVEKIGVQFFELKNMINSMEPFNKSLYIRVIYVNDLLHTILGLTELLKFYNPKSSIHHLLIHKVVKLNLRLLTLYDSFGFPNHWIEGYKDMVLSLSDELQLYVKVFDELVEVSTSLAIAFTSQINQARKSLHILAENSPENHVYEM